MKDPEASLRYARALFGLAKEAKELKKINDDFKVIIDVLGTHQEMRHIILNSTISHEETDHLIDSIFASKISSLLVRFFKVIVKKSRFAQIDDIQKIYTRLFEEEAGLKKVEVVTAKALSVKLKSKLIAVLKKKFNCEVELHEKTDPHMLGGLVVRFDGQEINASYRDRLIELKQILMQ